MTQTAFVTFVFQSLWCSGSPVLCLCLIMIFSYRKTFPFFPVYLNQSLWSDLLAVDRVVFALQQTSRGLRAQVTLNRKLMRGDRLCSKVESCIVWFLPLRATFQHTDKKDRGGHHTCADSLKWDHSTTETASSFWREALEFSDKTPNTPKSWKRLHSEIPGNLFIFVYMSYIITHIYFNKDIIPSYISVFFCLPCHLMRCFLISSWNFWIPFLKQICCWSSEPFAPSKKKKIIEAEQLTLKHCWGLMWMIRDYLQVCWTELDQQPMEREWARIRSSER